MRGQKGFTLIELLIAFAIFSIILAALYSSFFISHRAVMYNEESMLRLHEMRNALEGMRREIEGSITDSSNNFVVRDRDFYGKQASEFSFTTFSTPFSGVAKVSYSVVEDAETGEMNLLKKIYHAWEDEEDAREGEVLEGIVSFSVEVDSGGQWITTYDSTARPQHIRITIEIPIGGKTLSLSDTVKPMTGSEL